MTTQGTQMRPPAYLTRNLDRQQQALAVVQMQVQQALNLCGEWAAEELGCTVPELVQEYEFDGQVWRKKLTAEIPQSEQAAPPG